MNIIYYKIYTIISLIIIAILLFAFINAAQELSRLRVVKEKYYGPNRKKTEEKKQTK